MWISSNSLYGWPTILYSAQKKLAKDLWEAVNNDDVIKVRSLLVQGADPNHQLYWSDGWRYKHPPLHRACSKGFLEMVKTLVTHGARTDKGCGTNNMTPLHHACSGGHKQIVKYLIQELGCSTGKYRIYSIILRRHQITKPGWKIMLKCPCVASNWRSVEVTLHPRIQAAQIHCL